MHVLIAEHDTQTRLTIGNYLRLHGHQATCVGDGLTGLHLAVTQPYDALVFNAQLPGIDGYQACERLRGAGRAHLPFVIVAQARDLGEVLRGFKLGADDYLAGPLEPSELVARLTAITRRMARLHTRVLEVHDLTYDLDTLHVRRGEQAIDLNPTSLHLLELLMRKSPAVVSRQEMLDAVWEGAPRSSDTLRSNVHLLRRAVDKPCYTPLIHTLHGVGYQLMCRSA